jgi:hypothetical protein
MPVPVGIFVNAGRIRRQTTYLRSILPPKRPRECYRILDTRSHPQRSRQVAARLRNPAAGYSADKSQQKRDNTPVAFGILPCEQARVRKQIAQQTGNDNSRHLVESQCTAGNDLSGRLEAQQDNWNLVIPVGGDTKGRRGLRDYVSLQKSSRDEKQGCLDKE